MAEFRITLINGGLQEVSSTRALVASIESVLHEYSEMTGMSISTHVLDLRPLAIDTTRALVAGSYSDVLEHALDDIEESDAFVWASPIYAGAPSGPFLSFIDLIGAERMRNKPVILAATAASSRHTLTVDIHMRALASALRAQPTATAVFAAQDDAIKGGSGQLTEHIHRAVAELFSLLSRENISPRLLPASGKFSPSATQGQEAHHAKSFISAAHEEDHENSPVWGEKKKVQAPYLSSDGKAARLRPDVEDFTEMGEIFGPLSA